MRVAAGRIFKCGIDKKTSLVENEKSSYQKLSYRLSEKGTKGKSMLETIEKSISDSSWWFTVIFAGLIVGLGANVLKDLMYKFFGIFSNYFKIRSEQNKEIRKMKIKLLVANPTLLIVEYIHSAICTIIFIFSAISFFIWTIIYRVIYAESGNLIKIFYIVLWLFLGVITIILEIISSKQLNICLKAFRKYKSSLFDKSI